MSLLHKKHLAVGLIALLPFMGCDSYLDINDDPNRAVAVSTSSLLAPVLVSTSTNYQSLGIYTSMFSQQLAASSTTYGDADQQRDVRANTAWNNIYLRSLNNAGQIITQATADASPHYVGIAKVMQAMNLGLLTDNWGAAPFSEASFGATNTTPAYDTQEEIYTTINRLLDEAIVEFQKPAVAIRPTATDDIIYAGNITKWLKAANSLKARYSIHLTKKGAAAAATSALTYLPQAIQSNADDMQVTYNAKNLNPWNSSVAVGITTGNFTVAPSQTLVNLMNGTTYPGLVDPRLPFMADKRTNANYTGTRNGSISSGSTNLTAATYYAAPTAPILLVTNAEMKFIEAEARFLANGGSQTSEGSTAEAYAAYLAGIRAHMEKIGVAAADITTYLSNPSVSVGASKLTLSLIMKEKLIALYLNPEAWVDVRRYDYSPSIYPGMALPDNHFAALNGQYIRRLLYPLEEIARNEAEVNKVVAGQAEKLWWDQ